MAKILMTILIITSLQSFACEKPFSFELKNIAKDGIYSKMGLKNGDVIVKINKKEFCNMTQFEKFMNKELAKKKFILTIKRGKEEKIIKYDLK